MKLAAILAFSSQATSLIQNPLAIQHEVRSSPTDDLVSALDTMQSEFFQPWLGTWPDAIDWTRAVMGTHIAAGAHTFTSLMEDFSLPDENTTGGYFSHLVAYYFGQDSLAIRLQAYDDMLWVVLGWLDTIQLTEYHSKAHHQDSWYGRSFSPAFAHRARIFWELAAEGWDDDLCGGGMTWNPRLTPYKNAITNELFIAASINMYLYFPGDDNTFPFENGMGRHETKYLDAAIKGYDWLTASHMTTDQGLFFDGFHITGWSKNSRGTGKCDIPDKTVYTYNQGVILSAHRGLWSATGELGYLTSGHNLIRNVIAATGWSMKDNGVTSKDWSGLGRNGVLEEGCDSAGSCSQDGQTFKGIFFHHMAVFCQALPVGRQQPPFHAADKHTAGLHRRSCLEYAPWVERNARAAVGTMNDKGVMGMWWTVGLDDDQEASTPPRPSGTDYRNQGIPDDQVWRVDNTSITGDRFMPGVHQATHQSGDVNDRGRGRTVESHSGGVAVLRARAELHALVKS